MTQIDQAQRFPRLTGQERVFQLHFIRSACLAIANGELAGVRMLLRAVSLPSTPSPEAPRASEPGHQRG